MPDADREAQQDAEEAAGEDLPGAEAPLEEQAETEVPVEPTSESEIVALQAEVAELKDQLLRALAETENVRRRAQKERLDTAKYAAAPLLRDLLAVADNLGRAVDSVPESELAGDERLQFLLDGVKLTEKELNTAFDRHSVVRINPLGERLDPHRHEAMFEVPDPSQPSGTVVQVIQPGYLLHDRLLRPARVGIAKGGPAAGEPPREEPEGDQPPGSQVDTSV